MALYPEFTHLLNHHLNSRDRTPTWLAHRLNVNPSTVNRWLNLETRPGDAETVVRILEHLDIDSAEERLALLKSAGYGHHAEEHRSIEAQNIHAALAPKTPPIPGEPPYRGMHYFDVDDASLFFGRDLLTAELIDRLRTQRFVAIVGASGSGKSSLVRAGVVATIAHQLALTDGAVPPTGSDRWLRRIITPTAHPLESLALNLIDPEDRETSTATLINEMMADPYRLNLQIRKIVGDEDSNGFLLVIDQFEELFTLCRDRQEQHAFVDNLTTLARPDGLARVVITLRADFYANCAEFEPLRELLERHQRYIGPLNAEELRRAIHRPAQLNQWRIEPELEELLLTDLSDEPGYLPLLSHALLETWKRRSGRTMTVNGYLEAGRVQGAIAQTADSVYNALTEEQQPVVRNIFLRLTELGEGAQDTRRRIQREELTSQQLDRASVALLLNKLADSRLIMLDGDEVEVSHEALIREWPQLREWLADDRENLRIHRHLTEAAQEWTALEKDTEALYRGTRLDQTLAWAQTYADELNEWETEFLKQSQQRTERIRLRSVRRRQALLVGVIAAALLFASIAFWGWRNYALAQEQLGSLRVEQLQKEAEKEVAQGNISAAIALFEQIETENPELDLAMEKLDARRTVATKIIHEAEQLTAVGKFAPAETKFKEALALQPPSDVPVYIWVPAGEFEMGAAIDNAAANEDEKPARTVYTDGFWIMRTEVSNRQYAVCVERGNCVPPTSSRWDQEQFAHKPVTDVTWQQANTYAQSIGGRLPTEAEWEKACRGPDARIYPWGNDEPAPGLANYWVNKGLGTWADVGTYPEGANAYGLVDMAGNAWEWTADWYRPEYDDSAPDENPTERESGEFRTARGGSFSNFKVDGVRCTVRLPSEPEPFRSDIGFRVIIQP